MAVPDTDLRRIRRWAAAKTPPEFLHQMRLEVAADTTSVTIYDCRPPRRPAGDPTWTRQEVARLRWTDKYGTWTLYRADRHGKWHPYDQVPPSTRIDTHLTEIDNDPTSTFWG